MIPVNLLHPCSFMVYYHFFSVFPHSKPLISGFLQFKGNSGRDQNNSSFFNFLVVQLTTCLVETCLFHRACRLPSRTDQRLFRQSQTTNVKWCQKSMHSWSVVERSGIEYQRFLSCRVLFEENVTCRQPLNIAWKTHFSSC